MASLNRIVLVGRLAADPETRATLDGLPMAKFRLEVGRQQSIDQNYSYQSGTDLVDVVAWRRLAEVCGDSLKKGLMVLVEGKIQNRSFEDQTGERRWVTEVIAKNIQLLEKSKVPLDPARGPMSPVQSPKSTAEGSSLSQDVGPWTEDEVVDDSELAGDLPF